MIKRLTYILFSALNLVAVYVCGQNLRDVKSLADSHFYKQQFEEAFIEYQRAYFFETEHSEKCQLALRMAECKGELNELKNASTLTDSALIYAETDSLRNIVILNAIRFQVLREEYLKALQWADSLTTTGLSPNQINNFLVNKGISNFGLNRYKQSFVDLSASIGIADTHKLSILSDLFADTIRFSKHRIRYATWSSLICPGSGQIITGHTISGINSFLLNGSLIALAIYSPFGKPALLLPAIYRYYAGGVLHTYHFENEQFKVKRSDLIYQAVQLCQTDSAHIPIKKPIYQQAKFQHPDNHYHSDMQWITGKMFIFYKKYLSSQDLDACVFSPSCSEYTLQSVEKYGFIKGTLNGIDRLMRCHAFHPSKEFKISKINGKLYDPL
jgi:putative component of membrane protein insertase Oxa1/YidC/SpoIIIJ protein YidD/TM2 domain-containing membrane protein YozV